MTAKEFNDGTVLPLIEHAADHAAPRYEQYVDPDDLRQELAAYAYGPGRSHITQHLKTGDELAARRLLHNAAKQYCEREKAHASGYQFEDIAWYSPAKLPDYLAYALDSKWDGLTGEHDGGSRTPSGREGGTLLAMVADVRAALRACPDAEHVVRGGDPESDVYEEALGVLAGWLGGEFPDAPGFRRRPRVPVGVA